MRPHAIASLALAALLALATAAEPVRADEADGAGEPPAKAEAATDEAAAPASRTTAACIDQEIADRLAIKRKRRGAVDRLFVKQGRHEVSAGGGYYASDLLSGTYLLAGSYTYHMTDETAVEFSGAWTHANADIIRALEDKRGVVLTETYASMIFGEALLVWSGASGVLGFGMKLFAGNAVAFRIDARNRTFRQELLEERFLVNDTAITAGLSLFFPFRN
jgi:hypothetical protein